MYSKIAELIKDDSFSEDEKYKRWEELKKEETRVKTHGAEAIDLNHPLYDVYIAIREECNGGKIGAGTLPTLVYLYFMPPDLEQSHRDAVGIYGYGTIMIRKSFYDTHGVDDDVINNMFHEMVHAYCDMKIPERKIHDTDGEFHRKEFADVCEHFGGVCRYVNAEDGYCDVRLPDDAISRIKQRIKRIQERRHKE